MIHSLEYLCPKIQGGAVLNWFSTRKIAGNTDVHEYKYKKTEVCQEKNCIKSGSITRVSVLWGTVERKKKDNTILILTKLRHGS